MRGEQRPQGLTMMAMMRSRLKGREVSVRRQVGDAVSMVNEGGSGIGGEV